MRDELRINVQKQEENNLNFQGRRQDWLFRAGTRDLPERLSCLKCFQGHGGKDFPLSAHPPGKPAAALGFAQLGEQGEPEQCPCL